MSEYVSQVEYGKRDLQAPNHWQVLDSNYRITKPTVFCLCGNATITTSEANGFCKQVEGYLKLLFEGRQNNNVTENVDLVGFKYACLDANAEIGGLTVSFVKHFVADTLLPLFKDGSGKKLDLDQACRNMSQISFVSYCAGVREINRILEELNFQLRQMGYLQHEIDKINNSTMNISYAPLDVNANYVPTVRVVSYNDDMVGEDIKYILDSNELENFSGIKITRDEPGKIYGISRPDARAGSINIITSQLINALDTYINEHFVSLLARDENWGVKAYNRDGKDFQSSNADCVSQMIAWAVCRAVENSFKNSKENNYVTNNFYTDLVDELQSIVQSFSKDQLGINPAIKAKNRRSMYGAAKNVEVSKMAASLIDFHEPQSVIYSQLTRAKDYQEVVQILELNNYYFIDEMLPEIDFLNDDERKIIILMAKSREQERQEELNSGSSKETMAPGEICNKIMTASQKISGQYEEVIDVYNKYGYSFITDTLPVFYKWLTEQQKTALLDAGKAKRKAVKERERFVDFPTYDQMVDMLNNASSYEEILAILQKYNYCGVEHLLPEVVVLTEEEKTSILQLANKQLANDMEISD